MRKATVKSKKGETYHANCHNLELKVREKVIVKTDRGVELGILLSAPKETQETTSKKKMGSIIRKAGEVDFIQEERRHQSEIESFNFCRKKISYYRLPMKLVDAECLFDGSKIIFYFTAEERVDFRRLLKELISRFHTRIEIQQIGARTESKLIGGMGRCGRVLCCSQFLSDFEPVSIRMAKNQNFSLNPAKISGVCGRLMCCLGYEHKTYLEIKKLLPECGSVVSTEQGPGRVVKQNILNKKLLVQLEDGNEVELGPDELKEKSPDP